MAAYEAFLSAILMQSPQTRFFVRGERPRHHFALKVQWPARPDSIIDCS